MTVTEVVTEEGIPVTMPSGAVFLVVTQSEQRYLEDRVERYLADNHFVNVSDLQDVDRMLIMEVLCFRWGLWISRGRDYFDEPVDDKSLSRSLNDYSGELRQLKKILGIDKAARDRTKGDDSVPVFIENLLRRAKEFGVMRNRQCDKVLELSQELQALVTLHDNSDEIERREMHVTVDDIFDWIRTVYVPEFNAIDDDFRKSTQKYWIKQQ